jgi:glucosamine--fructose-6-phosphate aminotransferase (isomerizing)
MPGKILEKEIHEQPLVLRELIEQESSNISRIAQLIRGRFHHVVIAARGTSDNAARYAQYLFGIQNRLPVALATPSIYTLYQCAPNLSDTLIIGISQSGQSPDIVAVVKEGQQQGQPTIAITNDNESPLARTAEYTIDLHAGFEHAVAATKTYTASLVVFALLSSHLERDSDKLSHFQKIPSLLEQTLSDTSRLIPHFERYRYMEQCAVIGRGFNYGTAFEISLKITELAQVLALPYSSADFLHGPIAMVQKGFPVMMIAPSGYVLNDMRTMSTTLHEKNAELIAISNDPVLLGQAQLAIPLPKECEEWFSPLLAVIPGQLFALSLALARGLDPDQPEGLSKVTETW